MALRAKVVIVCFIGLSSPWPSQRARGLEKTHLKLGIRYSSSKPIAFCRLSSSLVLEASMWTTRQRYFSARTRRLHRGGRTRRFTRAKTPSSQSDGQGLSSRANASDLRKISPFGRNDNAFFLCDPFDFAQD